MTFRPLAPLGTDMVTHMEEGMGAMVCMEDMVMDIQDMVVMVGTTADSTVDTDTQDMVLVDTGFMVKHLSPDMLHHIMPTANSNYKAFILFSLLFTTKFLHF
ncbi:unnamed protein product [Orchesella dallaii]|uniref:Uncharacterized protein n=1 Tax=Orchesella dallaii TaxID=48710 RepID=A0ABP1R296_9HEXA